MRITDLGELAGEVLLFGGPVSNLHATEALIEAARARGIPPADDLHRRRRRLLRSSARDAGGHHGAGLPGGGWR